MTVYGVLLLAVMLVAWIAERGGGLFRAGWGGAFLALVLVPGLRDETIGTDSVGYVSRFERVQAFEDTLGQAMEPGFLALNWAIRCFSDEYVALFIGVAAISVAGFMWAILRDAADRRIAIFVFMTSGVYTFMFNGMRQSLACAVFSLALRPLVRRRFWQYSLIVLLAGLFHVSALLAIPAYAIVHWFDSRRGAPGRRSGGIIMKGVAITAFSGLALWSFSWLSSSGAGWVSGLDADIAKRYAGYLEPTSSTAGHLLTAMRCLVCGVFVACRRSAAAVYGTYDSLLALFMVGTAIELISAVLGLNPSGPRRISGYFLLAAVFLWPQILASLAWSRWRRIVYGGFAGGYVTFYILTVQRFGDIVPYRLNTSLLPHCLRVL